MQNILLVGLGGFVGSVVRYKMNGLVFHSFPAVIFPLGTFTVNLLGCFLIGVSSGLIEQSNLPKHEFQLLLITGFLGGFTTFSAFGLESLQLIRNNEMMLAAAYACLSVGVGIAMVALGFRLVNA